MIDSVERRIHGNGVSRRCCGAQGVLPQGFAGGRESSSWSEANRTNEALEVAEYVEIMAGNKARNRVGEEVIIYTEAPLAL